MFGLALRSLRKRAGGFLASFLAMFLGAAIIMAFASMLDTSIRGEATGAAAETLTVMAMVVGSWGLVLVILAVTSTLTLSVRQRAEEMALLKSIGATPAQLGRMVVGEAAGLALVAWALAIVPAMLMGMGLLSLLHSTDQVPESIGYAFGPIAPAMGLGITLVSAAGAAVITVRRTARARVAESLADAAVGEASMSRKRVVGGILFLLLALYLGVMTATLMRGKGTDAMAMAGQADIFAALGLALLAPWLIRRIAGALAGPLGRLGVAGDLAVSTMRRRTGQMAGVVMPIILFTGIAVGTIYLQEIENDATAAAGLLSTVEQKNIATLNFVVIGMILVFTALMLVNTLIAATAYRRREFGQQRLAGATPGQVLGAVTLEGVLLTGIGLVCGAFAALFTVIPFSIARVGTALPDVGPLTFAGVAAIAAALTMVTALGAARRAVRVPAIEAVAV
ncbi:FtsX-like permease family protein [Actinomadura sp. 9N407]|uniref:FtsX-like permease family protein n=1 Tax=Actinomadura sp. 9N407 TaxID=3375154 RepID=UPI00379A729B